MLTYFWNTSKDFLLCYICAVTVQVYSSFNALLNYYLTVKSNKNKIKEKCNSVVFYSSFQVENWAPFLVEESSYTFFWIS